MDKHQQEEIFINELEKRIDQLTKELDLTYPFVIGALSLIIHGIQNDYFED